MTRAAIRAVRNARLAEQRELLNAFRRLKACPPVDIPFWEWENAGERVRIHELNHEILTVEVMPLDL